MADRQPASGYRDQSKATRGIQHLTGGLSSKKLPLSGFAVCDESIQKNPKQVLAIVRAVFRAMAFAGTHPEETLQLLVNWLRLDREVAERSYELGKRSWYDGGVVSDAAVKLLVDQSMLELKPKDAVPLDKVRNWAFAEQVKRDMGNSVGGR